MLSLFNSTKEDKYIDFKQYDRHDLLWHIEDLHEQYVIEKHTNKRLESEKLELLIENTNLKIKLDKLEKTNIYSDKKMQEIIKVEMKYFEDWVWDCSPQFWFNPLKYKLLECGYIIPEEDLRKYMSQYSKIYKEYLDYISKSL